MQHLNEKENIKRSPFKILQLKWADNGGEAPGCYTAPSRQKLMREVIDNDNVAGSLSECGMCVGKT